MPTTVILLLSLLFPQASSPTRTVTGVVTDSECAKGDHSAMHMGDTNADCVKACVEYHEARFVLFDGTHTYDLSDQSVAGRFAAQRVTVTGAVDKKTHRITVQSIVAASTTTASGLR